MASFQELRERLNTTRNRQYVILGSVALLLIAGGVFLLGSSSSPSVAGQGHDVLYVCRNCRNSGTTRVAYSQRFPIRCPSCGKPAAMLGFACNGCGTIYEDTNQPYFTCPKCRYVYGTPPASAPAARAASPKPAWPAPKAAAAAPGNNSGKVAP